jgi:hypothetical protein
MILSKFNNEVLSRGSEAVLPQNLSREWLNKLNKLAEEFLDSNFSLDECKEPKDVADPILSTCVYEILRNKQGDIVNVSIEEMVEMIVIYSLSIVMEAVDRESDIGLEPPGLENILSMNRIVAFKKMNPEFLTVLEQACIVRDSDKGWLKNIKKKLLSSVLGM